MTSNPARGRPKLMGDGLLAEFASVVDALRCAVAVQRELTGRSADLDLEKRIALRIGINIGDVVVEAGDIYGDGVNVEALAEPDSICVYGRVQKDARGIFARLVPNARRCVVQAFV